MSGIYIHIPFCRHKCNYCNFYSLASTRSKAEVTVAIATELKQRKSYLANQLVETVYFGGGTPSLLDATEIRNILKSVYSNFLVSDDAEITLEANPDDITTEKLDAWKQAGINRLSIGIQSFNQEDLNFLSRTHTTAQVMNCIAWAQKAGFANLSIDLIYGIPTLTNDGWRANLQKAFETGVRHISAYSLTIEDKTPLEYMIRKGKLNPVDENLSASHYQILCEMMEKQGFEHYEISNFCLPGHYSRHNTAYWQGKHYLGIGPSAHSYNGFSRQWNVANLSKYLSSVSDGTVNAEHEVLHNSTRLNEYIMTSLRTMWGCDLVKVKSDFGSEHAENLMNEALHFIETKQMIYLNGKLILTPEGRLFTDGISAALFVDPDFTS